MKQEDIIMLLKKSNIALSVIEISNKLNEDCLTVLNTVEEMIDLGIIRRVVTVLGTEKNGGVFYGI